MMNIVKSEFLKLKHTWILEAHIFLPILYALIFYVASQFTSLKNFGNDVIIENYLVLLGVVLPIICGVITSKVIDMEANAGRFQVILSTTKSRSKPYIGKLIVLLVNLLISVSLSITVFSLLFGHQSPINCLIEVLCLTGGATTIYMIHLLVSVNFGSGVSIGLGFVETLLALLSMTAIGDDIWYFLPCTWSSRLAATYIVGTNFSDQTYLYRELNTWLYVSLPLTLIIFWGSVKWVNYWDGNPFID
ncbi:lantibiotic immunity ABC transporter MutG family permease subunit [Streptococcus pluranimalium]|uniref:Lantibiotic immunity ABC transporter MutG family permease subunit n=1 Tax=Streptococcus pluranimalium TaxID=82348 RepID=A0A2L0D5C0_9STRE|nr:lantibiotic immunity ABC transporter MutG family permease subunit [Streptococcus pluranimalium]AUW96850.1 lantibiotic immunity ABC transporter MutG family permease subunit [Streptococcus pluranimalium]